MERSESDKRKLAAQVRDRCGTLIQGYPTATYQQLIALLTAEGLDMSVRRHRNTVSRTRLEYLREGRANQPRAGRTVGPTKEAQIAAILNGTGNIPTEELQRIVVQRQLVIRPITVAAGASKWRKARDLQPIPGKIPIPTFVASPLRQHARAVLAANPGITRDAFLHQMTVDGFDVTGVKRQAVMDVVRRHKPQPTVAAPTVAAPTVAAPPVSAGALTAEQVADAVFLKFTDAVKEIGTVRQQLVEVTEERDTYSQLLDEEQAGHNTTKDVLAKMQATYDTALQTYNQGHPNRPLPSTDELLKLIGRDGS